MKSDDSKPAAPAGEKRSAPLYRQIRDAIARDIRERELAPHSQYLSESGAMEKYGVSRVTIRQAFRLLEQEHLLYRTHGKGTFVAPPPVDSAKTVAFLATCVLLSGVETVMLRSIEEYFDHRDVNLIICNHEDSYTRAERYIRRLVQLGVDGIIYMAVCSSSSYEKNSDMIRLALDAGIPCIQIDRYVDSMEKHAVSVRPDNYGGSRMITRHLIGLGHKRIAFCGNTMSSAVRDRRDGCIAALRESGLDLPAEYQMDFLTEKDYRSVALQISTMAKPPSAVVCVSDDAAIRLIQALHLIGLEVPSDIAVVGFDDYTSMGQAASCGLTTVKVGHWDEGRIAASLMVELLSGKVIVPKAYIIPVELVVRESCGSRILANRSNTPEGRHRLLEQLT